MNPLGLDKWSSLSANVKKTLKRNWKEKLEKHGRLSGAELLWTKGTLVHNTHSSNSVEMERNCTFRKENLKIKDGWVVPGCSEQGGPTVHHTHSLTLQPHTKWNTSEEIYWRENHDLEQTRIVNELLGCPALKSSCCCCNLLYFW